MFARGPPILKKPPPPPPSDDESDFDEDEPPPPPDSEEEEYEDDDDPPPPSESDKDEPEDEDFDDSILPPPSSNEDDDLPPPSEEGDSEPPPSTILGSSPPNSLPGSSRPSVGPPSDDDDDDIPPPPSTPPPPKVPSAKLPVLPPSIRPDSLKAQIRAPASDPNVDSLNQGLNLKNLSSSGAIRTSINASLFGTEPVTQIRKVSSVIKENNKLEEGFIEVQGKFEGDSFETLMIKSTKTELIVRCTPTEEAVFDLLDKSYVFEDLDDPKCFVLEHAGSIIIFKAKSRDDVTAILASMPREVFEAPKKNDIQPPKAKMYYPDDSRVKGVSIDDFLQGGPLVNTINRAELDKIFSPRPRRATIYGVGKSKKARQRRKELIDTHIKKPLYSIRRVKQLSQWINSLHIWHQSIDIFNLHQQFCNGLLLAKLMKVFVPDIEYLHMNERALAEKPAMENIEKVLGTIWRSKTVNNSRIPTAKEVYEGNVTKIVVLLQELFDVHIHKPLYSRALKMFKWYTAVLRQYDLALPSEIFSEGDLSNLWPHFQSGTAIFCVIYHFFGPTTVGRGNSALTIDPLRVTADPRSISEFRANIGYVFQLLRALNVEIFWETDDWITHPDTEFIMLQLANIYDAFKEKQCSLPPAQGSIAGVTSGPNGEPRVVGLIFADTYLTNRVSVERMARTVLLGSGEDALPLLPIDNTGLSDFKYYSPVCPQGLLSFMSTSVKILHATVELKDAIQEKSRNWNASSHPGKKVEKPMDDSLLMVLRSSNKVSENKLYGDESRGLKMSAVLNTSAKSIVTPGLSIEGIQTEEELEDLLNVQYHEMLDTLEKDMKSSKIEAEAQEDDLADRYAQLENIADRITDEEYNRIFNQLESESKMLELERYRVEEHYKLRLTSIKVQRKETLERFKAQFQSKRELATSVTSARSVASNKTRPKPIDKQKAEKGWLRVANNNTHNIHIQRLASKAISTIQAMHTPRKYLTAKSTTIMTESLINDKMSTLDITSAKIDDLNKTTFEVAENIDSSDSAVFDRFRERLYARTQKWFDDRNAGPSKLKVSTRDYQTAPPKLKKQTLIPVPVTKEEIERDNAANKAASMSDEKKDAYEYMSRAIREEEMAKMKYEDDRRRRYLNQLPSVQSRRASVLG